LVSRKKPLYKKLFKASKTSFNLTQTTINETFPTATHASDDESVPPYLSRDIIIQNYNFLDEVHNEDFHFNKLISFFQ
jgi:hypothetical protein